MRSLIQQGNTSPLHRGHATGIINDGRMTHLCHVTVSNFANKCCTLDSSSIPITEPPAECTDKGAARN